MSGDETPYVPTGAGEEPGDVIGKLDGLIGRHRPRSSPQEVPVLTEALPQGETPIPTLTDIVARPAAPSRNAETGGLEAALVQRLAMRLEVEKARLLAEGAGADRAAAVEDLVARLRESLPDIVRIALERGERR
ncbi:MAG TPA: hypothetical protein VHA15_11840 [Burkholderiales bacterium]|jgi:hypothetical protein|nr:hypothetical protein [Burkholderiales bacterium]